MEKDLKEELEEAKLKSIRYISDKTIIDLCNEADLNDLLEDVPENQTYF